MTSEITTETPMEHEHKRELLAIAQAVAILGEGMKISRELAEAARKATGIGL